MSKIYSPRIVQDGLVMCLDPSQNKSYATTDLPIKDGLLVWLDAADDSTFSYSSGTEVSQWRDKSGNNFHASQSTTANQPSRSNALNSRKSVNFVAANGDSLRISSGVVFSRYFTAIVLIKPGTQSAAYAVVLDQDHGYNGAYQGWVIQRNASTSFWQTWIANSSATNWTNTNQISYTDNTPQIVTYRKTSSTLTLYSNATSSGDVVINDYALTQNGYFGLNIGYWRAGADLYSDPRRYNGEICEILIYNRDLSTTELKQVHTYLGQKWGISNTDRSIIDLSGFNDNGLLGNGSTSNMPLFDYYNKGVFKFFASNKYIKLGNNTNINQFTGDFTISLWAMAMAENSNYGNLIGDYYTAGVATTNEWQIMMNNSSTALNVYRHGTGYVINNTASGFSANTWINVVLTRVGSAISLYANNTVIATATNSSVFGSATGSVNIGIDGNNAAEPFSGLISNVLIYQKGLSAAEVAQNYQAQKSKFDNTIVQQGLVLNLDASNPYSYAGAGTTFYDVSGNNNYFQLTNSPTYVSTDPKNFSLSAASSQHFLYYASIGNPTGSTGISLPSANSWTCAFWFRTSTNTTYNPFLSHMGSGPVYCIMGTTGTTLTYYHYNGGWFFKNATTNILDNVWHQAVFVNTANTMIIYLDGVVEKASFDSTVSGTSNLVNGFGGSWTGTFTGNLANFMYYNTNLSAAQVLQNYNATKGRFGL